MLSVADLMLREVPRVGASTTISDAFAAMEAGPMRHLPVCDGDKLIGIVSDRDLLRHMPVVRGDETKAEHQRYVESPIGHVMTPQPITAHVEQSVQAAVSLLLRARVSALPVVDSSGRLLGMFTLLEAARAFMALEMPEPVRAPRSDLSLLRERLEAVG